MITVTLDRIGGRGQVAINPDSVSDIRLDGNVVVVRLNNGASYRLSTSLSLADVTTALHTDG